MKYISKTVSLLLAAVMVMMLFSGCSTDEMEVFNAYIKHASVSSGEAKTSINIQAELEGLPEQVEHQQLAVLQFLRNINLTMIQKFVKNDDYTVMKGQMDVALEPGGTVITSGLPTFNGSLWIDYDAAGDEPSMKQIYKVPVELTATFPEGFRGKEYIVFDMGKMPDGKSLNVGKMQDVANVIKTRLLDYMKNYAETHNPGFDIVKYKGTAKINGENHRLYEAKIDDKSFKDLLRYTLINIAENENTVEFIKDYATVIYSMTSKSDEDTEQFKNLLSTMLEQYNTLLPIFKAQFNAYMDELDKVKILGDSGIVLEYAINKDGYLASETGTIDLCLDLKELQQLSAQIRPEGQIEIQPEGQVEIQPEPVNQEISGVLKIKMTVKTEIYDINKDVSIEFPEVNESNSSSYIDLIEAFAAASMRGNTPIKVEINNKRIDLSTPPVVQDGRTLLPVRDVFEGLGAEVTWDGETKTVTGVKGDTKIVLTLDSVNASVNGNAVVLDVPAIAVDGRTFVPVRFVGESFGAEVIWDDATKTIRIITE